MFNIQKFITRSQRIMQISMRPKSKEYWQTAKVCALGMVLIGVIGLLITLFFGVVDAL
ncbi:Uncharacterised protein [Candidatus Gugararchaeum adminiculabundum]|nr:Uncharacterised protein [Candidatus Gugararchaeum adminiculabundum]